MQRDLFKADALERRSTAEVELRAKGKTLYGYAAVYDVETNIAGAYTETIRAGAFDRSLASGRDVLGLLDHDPGIVLSRTRSGSLKLASDSKGLAFEMLLPDTSHGRDVRELAERGDLGGMSFAFQVRDDAWNAKKRELRDLDLFEISVISAWPAYAQTEVYVRNAIGGGVSRVTLSRRWLETAGG